MDLGDKKPVGLIHHGVELFVERLSCLFTRFWCRPFFKVDGLGEDKDDP